MLRVLDLFSGIGGFSLGLERTGGFETVAFCEIEPFCQRVLRKHWSGVRIHEDVRTLKGSDVGAVDVICGGYPCQPFSTAGKRRGKEDDRHLWPEFSRLVAELRPTWVIGENVAGHISMGLDDVLSDLEGQGYSARAFVIPACAVDAPHRRDRTWVVGNSHSHSQPSAHVAHPIGQRGRSRNAERQDAEDAWQSPCSKGRDRSRVGAWLSEPEVGRVANGVPNRVDRLRALGNAVVPQVVEMIGRAILAAEANR